MTLTGGSTFLFASWFLRIIQIIESMDFFIRLDEIVEIWIAPACKGVTYENLDLLAF